MCKECAHERDLQIKLEEERDQENFVGYVEACFQITPSDEQKGIRELHEDFNKQTYTHQTTSHQDLLCMYIYEHSNGLASTIDFKCNRKKQDKRLNNHHFPLRLPQQTIHHSGDARYTAINWCIMNLQWVFGMHLIGGWEEGQQSSWEFRIYLGRGSGKKHLQTLKHMQACLNCW